MTEIVLGRAGVMGEVGLWLRYRLGHEETLDRDFWCEAATEVRGLEVRVDDVGEKAVGRAEKPRLVTESRGLGEVGGVGRVWKEEGGRSSSK